MNIRVKVCTILMQARIKIIKLQYDNTSTEKEHMSKSSKASLKIDSELLRKLKIIAMSRGVTTEFLIHEVLAEHFSQAIEVIDNHFFKL